MHRLGYAALGSGGPGELAERSGIKSIIAIAVHPKVDKPYAFALHQCSYPRVWTPHEERLFHEIGRRLADALDTLLMFRNLRESQRKLEGSRAELAASRARIVTVKTLARRSAVPVLLEVRAETRLPEPVEVAAYYIVSEALTNTAKHAHASVAHVQEIRGCASYCVQLVCCGAGTAAAAGTSLGDFV